MSRLLAQHILDQWEKHDKYRVVPGEEGEPDEVILARALLNVDKEYGCEVRDPYGTIWQQAAAQGEALKKLAWALVTVLEGTPQHDIQGMTGLNEADCLKVHQARLDAQEIIR